MMQEEEVVEGSEGLANLLDELKWDGLLQKKVRFENGALVISCYHVTPRSTVPLSLVPPPHQGNSSFMERWKDRFCRIYGTKFEYYEE